MTAVELAPAKLTEPGVFDLTDEQYFADPVPGGSLSSTGVRELLAAPAKFRHNQLHARPPKRTFDVGHAAHLSALHACKGTAKLRNNSRRELTPR